MKTKEMFGIIGIVLIVALVLNLVTMSLTGNLVIRQGFGSKAIVTTNQEVLNMLNKCIVTSTTSVSEKSCDAVCKNNKKICTESYTLDTIKLSGRATQTSNRQSCDFVSPLDYPLILCVCC